MAPIRTNMLTYIPPHIRESTETIIGDIDECSYADRTKDGEPDVYALRILAAVRMDEFILSTIEPDSIPGCRAEEE